MEEGRRRGRKPLCHLAPGLCFCCFFHLAEDGPSGVVVLWEPIAELLLVVVLPLEVVVLAVVVVVRHASSARSTAAEEQVGEAKTTWATQGADLGNLRT